MVREMDKRRGEGEEKMTQELGRLKEKIVNIENGCAKDII